MEATQSLLSIKGLSKNFGGVRALDGLDLEVRRNRIMGLIGPNGSGKTTFFNVVTGIYPASAGSVVLEGEDITSFSPQRVYRRGWPAPSSARACCCPCPSWTTSPWAIIPG